MRVAHQTLKKEKQELLEQKKQELQKSKKEHKHFFLTKKKRGTHT